MRKALQIALLPAACAGELESEPLDCFDEAFEQDTKAIAEAQASYEHGSAQPSRRH